MLACSCNRKGTNQVDRCVPNGGQCSCYEGIGGRTCNYCLAGYYGFGDWGCKSRFLCYCIVAVAAASYISSYFDDILTSRELSEWLQECFHSTHIHSYMYAPLRFNSMQVILCPIIILLLYIEGQRGYRRTVYSMPYGFCFYTAADRFLRTDFVFTALQTDFCVRILSSQRCRQIFAHGFCLHSASNVHIGYNDKEMSNSWDQFQTLIAI